MISRVLILENISKTVLAKIPVVTFVLSLIVAWLLVPITSGFPMVPFFIFFVCLSSLVYAVRKDRSWFDVVLYIGILALSCFLLIRADMDIQFINFLFIILFGSILILPIDREHTLTNLFLTPFFVVNEALTGNNIFPYSWSSIKKYNKTNNIKGYIPSILVTLLFLGITIPLLASANPFFNQLIQNILKFLNLTELMRYFQGNQIFFYIVRFWIFMFLAYVIPHVLTASHNGIKINTANFSMPVNYLIPKVAMGILLIVFFITQAQLYFATPEVLQSMGYTNSRLTNEVFLQVTVVAFIIFFLAYLDRERKTWNKRLSYFLILEAFFLVCIAFKSVFDYSFLWGFTQKRLWGYATMSWLTGALMLFVYYYKKQIPILYFFQLIISFTIFVLVGINFANFDYLISHYSKAKLPTGTDYVYLSRLSPDAAFYKETLNNLIIQIEESSTREIEKINATNNVLRKIENLKQKYSNNIPLNSFNFSEYSQYLSVKDVDTQGYRNRLSVLDQMYKQPERINSLEQPPETNFK